MEDVDLAGGQDVEAVAVGALADDDRALGRPDRGHGGGHALGHLGGQGANIGISRSRASSAAHGGDHLGPGQAGPDAQGGGQHQPAGGEQGAAHLEQADGRRHDADPTPIAAMLTPSSTPKTRLRTSLGALRWSSRRPRPR